MSDRTTALGLLLTGATYLGFSLRIENAVIGTPWGPKLLPILVGCALVTLSLVLLWQSRHTPADRRSLWGGGLPLVGVVAVTGFYAVVFNFLGYLIATVLCLFGLLLIFAPRRWLRSALVASIFSACAYVVFHVLLGVYLPAGILG